MKIGKIISLVSVLTVIMLCFSGCAAREFLAKLGFDTHDYDGEEIIETYSADSEKAEQIGEMVRTLTLTDCSIPTFNSSKEAIAQCRDSLLNYMLNERYAKYTGNIDLLEAAAEEYPHMRFSVIIPADDFANEAYKYFGGKEKVSNRSGEMFEYLDRIECYITAAQPQKSEYTVNVLSLDETENTFRLRFSCSLDDSTTDTYFALIIKRQDESCYFKCVRAE